MSGVKETRIERGTEWYPTGDQIEDCQCARCGSSVALLDCWNCGGEGEIEERDTEDYGDEYSWRPCDVCFGRGGRLRCISTPEHCEAHPIPGREHIESTAMKSEAWND